MLDRLGEHLREVILPRLDSTVTAVEKLIVAEKQLIAGSLTGSADAAARATKSGSIGIALLVAAVFFLSTATSLVILTTFETSDAILVFAALAAAFGCGAIFFMRTTARTFHEIQSCLTAINSHTAGAKLWSPPNATNRAMNM